MLSDKERLGYLADFGGPATVAGDDILALYEFEFIESNGVESYAPVLVCRTSDVSDVEHGDPVTVAGNANDYTVAGVQPDDAGFTTLVLEEVPA